MWKTDTSLSLTKPLSNASKMKASTMTSYSLNLIDLSQSCNQRILEASKPLKYPINFYFLSGLLPLSAREMQLCSVSIPPHPFHTLALTHRISSDQDDCPPVAISTGSLFLENPSLISEFLHMTSVLISLMQLEVISFSSEFL